MNRPSLLRLENISTALAGFDDIIDVRAPSEFAQDHLPGAINLPVLSDDERAQVGTIYKQVSPFDARKIGAALVAANSARHIAGALADRPGGWCPLIYCWRGGQRSGAFSTILAQIGWRVSLIEGGYKSWRRLVSERVEHLPFPAPMLVLDGNTGSAKTALLAEMAAQGAQIIDLEALANHRGSLFGAMGEQPSQKLFEGRLALAVEALDPARPVIVEAESSRIGEVIIPHAIWAAICAAPRLRLSVPVKARAAFIARAYSDVTTDPARIEATINRLAALHPAERIALWHDEARRGAWQALAEGLMRDHYDPRYEKHRTRYATHEHGVVHAESLKPEALPALAQRIQDEAARIMDGARVQRPD